MSTQRRTKVPPTNPRPPRDIIKRVRMTKDDADRLARLAQRYGTEATAIRYALLRLEEEIQTDPRVPKSQAS